MQNLHDIARREFNIVIFWFLALLAIVLTGCASSGGSEPADPSAPASASARASLRPASVKP